MFCGIVDHTGTLLAIEEKPKSLLFRIQSEFTELSLGESIAIDGVCLTVTSSDDALGEFECELSPETLNVSIAGNYTVGQRLNLERAMKLNDRIGGHLVTGHVDETLRVNRKQQYEEFVEFYFSDFSQSSRAYLIAKGSVAINGVSLTVNTVDDQGFSVMLIPHTLERTNLANLVPGQRVNVEWDYVAKLILNKNSVRFEGSDAFSSSSGLRSSIQGSGELSLDST